jgi:ribonucleoside-diphosphate reductase alpha chain
MTGGDKDKRKVWARIVQKRFESGYPYVFFTDTVNRGKPQVYKDKGMDIHASNLCSEICLPSSDAESFVCDLSSMNLLHWDEWKSTDAAEVLTYFLDAVMSDYITKTKDVPFMAAAHHFSVNHRALGVGVLGWHSYLQSKSIAFESMEAKLLNTQIHRLIRDKALVASKRMAKELGEPPLLKGYGLRNTTLMAIAPTTSSSFILGQVSPSIEPLNSNYFVKGLAKGKFTYRNPYLEKVLETYSKNDQKTWEDILVHGGSVQHLTFLTDHEKDVFKTFGEISPKEIIIQAAARQKFIDQSQSLNLMIPTETPPKDASQLLIDAWKMGVKTIYYQRGSNPAQQLARDILTCKSCEA